MAGVEASEFRLAVLNPAGRDPEQHFTPSRPSVSREHAPVNFHAYAACTGGAFFRNTAAVLATGWPVLLLLRGDFRAATRALHRLRQAGRPTAIALKETGSHQIAQQLGPVERFARFSSLVRAADGCVASTPEAAELYQALGSRRVAFIPTPYPIEEEAWDCSSGTRRGIFIGTRELNVPSRNHLAALLAAKRVSEATGEPVTVFNCAGRKGRALIAEIGFAAVQVHEKRQPYHIYLREVARHKLIFQLDRSQVPGQVAGDALLARNVCVGGDGAIERIAFPETCGANRSNAELSVIAERLLGNDAERLQLAERGTLLARQHLSFAVGRCRLADFFQSLRQ